MPIASRLAAIVLAVLPAAVAAEPAADVVASTLAADPGDQGVGAEVGIASGGALTPGGLRVAGHYLYQLSQSDWFDGAAAFTFGADRAGCTTDGMPPLTCNHGFTDGDSVEISASVRRLFAPQGAFRPFARAGVGIALVRFTADDVAGVAVPLHLGAGVRARVAPRVAVVAQGDLQLGLGGFNRGLGVEAQLGMAFTAGAEFDLR